MMKLIMSGLILLLASTCEAATQDQFISKLEKELKGTDAQQAAGRLTERWDEEMMPLLKGARDCAPAVFGPCGMAQRHVKRHCSRSVW